MHACICSYVTAKLAHNMKLGGSVFVSILLILLHLEYIGATWCHQALDWLTPMVIYGPKWTPFLRQNYTICLQASYILFLSS